MKSLALKFLRGYLKITAKLTLRKYNPTIVGVTGSVGKTSTKEMLGTVLKAEKPVRVSSKSFNNEIGLPLTILGSWQKTGGKIFWLKVIVFSLFQLIVKNPRYPQILVLEYGVDRPGDMRYLLDIARPQIGVFTAMGGKTPVHVEFFSGPDAIFREKSKLINQLPATGFAVLNADDKVVSGSAELTRAQNVKFGFGESADVRIVNFSHYFEPDSAGLPVPQAGIKFKLTYGGSFVPLKLVGVVGQAQALAAAAAAAVGLIFNMNLVKVSDALSGHKTPPGRMKVINGVKGSLIIDDTYNSSPAAATEALEAFGSFKKAKRKIAVLGDMLELGKHTLAAHEEIGKIAAKRAKILVAVGTRAKLAAEAAIKAGMDQKDVFSFPNLSETEEFLLKNVREGDVILVKGSQGVRLERVVRTLLADPIQAEKLLVRQEPEWLKIPGLYG